MIKQIAISKSHNNKIVFSDYYPNRTKFFTLFIHYYEDTPIIYDTLGEIMELVLKFINNKQDIKSDELLSFMNDLNWISAGKLRNLPLNNQGISLGLVFVDENKIKALRYGRILMGKVLANKLEFLGPDWSNFSVKSLEHLSLLGLISEDKYPELFDFELKNNQQFVILESDASDLFKSNINKTSELSNTKYVYQILECHRKDNKKNCLELSNTKQFI